MCETVSEESRRVTKLQQRNKEASNTARTPELLPVGPVVDSLLAPLANVLRVPDSLVTPERSGWSCW